MGRVCLAQEADAGTEVIPTDTAIYAFVEDLKGIPSIERSPEMEEIARIGTRAVPHLIKAIDTPDDRVDLGYYLFCIEALRMLEAREATGALIRATLSPVPAIRYVAATALGELWTSRGRGDSRPEEEMKQVNAVLAASAYVAGASPGVFAPGMALAGINGVDEVPSPFEQGKSILVKNLGEAEMLAFVRWWQVNNAGRLPPSEEQPWSLVLTTAIDDRDAARRQNARDNLTLDNPQEVVEEIATRLGAEGVSPARWRDLAGLATAISTVELDPNVGPDGRVDALKKWRDGWVQKLRKSMQPKEHRFTWARFEEAIAAAYVGRTQAAMDEADMWEAVVIEQLESLDQIPESASEEARRRVAPSITVKALFIEGVATLKVPGVSGYEKKNLLGAMRGSARPVQYRAIGVQFIDELVGVARQSEDSGVLQGLAELLEQLTGVPLTLSGQSTQEDRHRMLDGWLDRWRKRKFSPGAGSP
ncbi:MAG: hypothetical protein QGI33_01415 [Candidatus Brocadiia bacterium]|nr:hypothetical protein [Candidatus Brocadiia bacterium]